MTDFLRSDAVLRCFINALTDYAIVILDTDGYIVDLNEGARIIKRYSRPEAIGRHFSIFYTPEAVATGHPERELATAAATGRYDEEGWRVRQDGTRFWVHVIIIALYDDQKVLRGFGKILRDSTAQKQEMEQAANVMKLLEFTAKTDYLTSLDNRRSFDKALAAALSYARRRERPLCLAMLDIDQYKQYNDTHGHLAGDDYLKETASVWRKNLRPEDTLARFGGDEFSVLLVDTALPDAAKAMERLRSKTVRPLTCSIGVVEWDGAETPAAFIARADEALYAAKTSGRNRVSFSESQGAAKDTSEPVEPNREILPARTTRGRRKVDRTH